MGNNGGIPHLNNDTIMYRQQLYAADESKFDSANNSSHKNVSIFIGSLHDKETEEGISMLGTTKGVAPAVEAESKALGELGAESKAMSEIGAESKALARAGAESKALAELGAESKALAGIGAEAKGIGKLGEILNNTRGAAYMNDVGEGLKPAIGQAIAKRCWYPSLIYVGASVYDKTFHDKYGNKDFSIRRGSQELAFQTLASLCGPILLVNLGQNTIGKLLSGVGNCIGKIRQGINPFKNITKQAITSGAKNVALETGKGVLEAAKELPKDLWSTISLAFSDITHPLRTGKKIGYVFKEAFKAMKKLPSKSKNVFNTFKADKTGFIFGKNGILFGQKGLFGENGLLFGQKSGRVIGGLLGILLLYKVVDKAAARLVGRKEE